VPVVTGRGSSTDGGRDEKTSADTFQLVVRIVSERSARRPSDLPVRRVRTTVASFLEEAVRRVVRACRLHSSFQTVRGSEPCDLHRLLTRRLNPNEAIASGAASVDGDASQLQDLIELFTFPALDPAGVD
jgi:hypothetical protein